MFHVFRVVQIAELLLRPVRRLVTDLRLLPGRFHRKYFISTAGVQTMIIFIETFPERPFLFALLFINYVPRLGLCFYSFRPVLFLSCPLLLCLCLGLLLVELRLASGCQMFEDHHAGNRYFYF